MVTVIMSIFHERRAQRVNGILRWPFKITGLPKFLGGLNLVVSSRENLVPQRSCVAALTLSVLLLSVAGVSAANNWYVVPGGAGNKGGTAWTNAWDVSSISWSSVGAGDTIWLAGGLILIHWPWGKVVLPGVQFTSNECWLRTMHRLIRRGGVRASTAG